MQTRGSINTYQLFGVLDLVARELDLTLQGVEVDEVGLEQLLNLVVSGENLGH